MRVTEQRFISFGRSAVGVCAMLLVASTSFAATNSARQQVRTGLQQHAAGEYSAAAESFAEAEKILTDEPRVTYDRACALAAQGKREEATDLFQQVAVARSPELVAASHYNLGCLVAQEAKALFGEDPAAAEVATREQGIKLLQQAVMHYRDCLRVERDHDAARRNLELLRLWIKHMNDVWAQRDRDKRRDEMDLLQFLEWIDSEQRNLEAATKALGQLDGSPRQRQAIAKAETAQRLLADEIEPLQEKLRAAVAADQPADATTTQAANAMDQIALKAKSAMFRAADELVVRDLLATLPAQSEAINSLNEIYRAVAPYEHVLQKATKTEDSLVTLSGSMVEVEDADEVLVDVELTSRDQQYIAGWSDVLAARARQGLTQLDAGQVTQPQIGPPSEEEQAKQQQTQAAMKESYEKAIEYAPKISELAVAAAEELTKGDWQAAHPKQEEALRLLKEITPKTPPEEDQQDKQNEDQEQQDEKNNEQDQQDQQGQDEQQPDDSQDQKKGDKQDEQKKKQQQQKNLSRQQAEALLSKARQREREQRDRRKEQLRAIQGAVRVERDW